VARFFLEQRQDDELQIGGAELAASAKPTAAHPGPIGETRRKGPETVPAAVLTAHVPAAEFSRFSKMMMHISPYDVAINIS